MILIEEDSFLRKVGKFANKVKRTYDYYLGNSDTKYNFAERAPNDVLRASDFKDYVNDGTEFSAKMDRDAGMLRIEVDATKVGSKLAPLLNPKSEDKKMLKYVKKYDKGAKEVTLILPITDEGMLDRLKGEEDIPDDPEDSNDNPQQKKKKKKRVR